MKKSQALMKVQLTVSEVASGLQKQGWRAGNKVRHTKVRKNFEKSGLSGIRRERTGLENEELKEEIRKGK